MGVSIVSCHQCTFRISPLLVGRIIHQGVQQPEVPAPPPHITTPFGPRTSGDTTPNPESRSEGSATLDTGIEVEHHMRSPDDTESSVPDPLAVRCPFYLCPKTLTATCAI